MGAPTAAMKIIAQRAGYPYWCRAVMTKELKLLFPSSFLFLCGVYFATIFVLSVFLPISIPPGYER
jgi:hypothetical protein